MHLEFGEKPAIQKLDLCLVQIEQCLEITRTDFHTLILSQYDMFHLSGHLPECGVESFNRHHQIQYR